MPSTESRQRLRRIDHELAERHEWQVAQKMADSCGLRLTGGVRHCTLTMPSTGWAVHATLSRYEANRYTHDRGNRGPCLNVPAGWTLADLILAAEERWLPKRETTEATNGVV